MVFSEDIEISNKRSDVDDDHRTRVSVSVFEVGWRIGGPTRMLESLRFRCRLNEVLVESAKDESMWQALYESGAFESMAFRALGDVAIENLSESEKAFCVRMAKEMVRVPAGEFHDGSTGG